MVNKFIKQNPLKTVQKALKVLLLFFKEAFLERIRCIIFPNTKKEATQWQPPLINMLFRRYSVP
jgi:hypothetical protein